MVYMALNHHEFLPFVDERITISMMYCLYIEYLIRTVSNLFTMISTNLSILSSNIVYIAIFLQELLPFVHEIMPLFAMFIL